VHRTNTLYNTARCPWSQPLRLSSKNLVGRLSRQEFSDQHDVRTSRHGFLEAAPCLDVTPGFQNKPSATYMYVRI
jgi:hypothetical protein